MKHRNYINAAIMATLLAAPVSAQAFDLSALGITAPAASGPLLCDIAPNDDAFNSFNCPLMVEAMWWGDATIVAGTSRAQQLTYISSWVQAIHEPSIVWKVDPTVYGQLDPRLPMHINYVVSTNKDVMGEMMGEGMGILLGGLNEFLDARRSAVDNGTIDPLGEMAALMSGAAHAAKPIKLTTMIANQDVMSWVGLAQRDPDSAIQLYQGMRDIALNF